jgi:hypothetical protein
MKQGAPKTPDKEQPYGLYLPEFKEIDSKDYERLGREHFSVAESIDRALVDLKSDFDATKRTGRKRTIKTDFELNFRCLSNLYYRTKAFMDTAVELKKLSIGAALQPLVEKMEVMYKKHQDTLTNKMPVD